MEDINTASVTQVIQVSGSTVLFPFRHLELYFVDYLEDRNIVYEITGEIVTITVQSEDDSKRLANQLYAQQISTTHSQHWYPLLEGKTINDVDVTFKSVLIPLTEFDLQVLLDPMRPEEDLADKMITAANQLRKGKIFLFIRLNSLSPKAPGNKFNPRDPEWAGKAIQLIRNSTRCCHTLENSDIAHFLMLREWVSIDPAMEFRCFIYRSRLTAISQYHCYNRYKSLTASRVIEIRDFTTDFYRKVFPTISELYEDCVMDVIVRPDGHVQIVEFNSFGADGLAGSGLYNWIRDESILLNIEGGNPDIRVVPTV